MKNKCQAKVEQDQAKQIKCIYKKKTSNKKVKYYFAKQMQFEQEMKLQVKG